VDASFALAVCVFLRFRSWRFSTKDSLRRLPIGRRIFALLKRYDAACCDCSRQLLAHTAASLRCGDSVSYLRDVPSNVAGRAPKRTLAEILALAAQHATAGEGVQSAR
jgi:hypothetical protein